MLTKASIIVAFFNAFIWFQIHNIDTDIKNKTAQAIELRTEIEEAQKTIGLAETVDYVEKIGLVKQIEGQIVDLEREKDQLESKIKTQ